MKTITFDETKWKLVQKLDASIAWLERGELLPGSAACIGLDDIKAIRAVLAAPQVDAASALAPANRPQNCGTSYCSCIECVCEPSNAPTASASPQAKGRAMSDRELLELAAKAAGMLAGEYCEPNHEPSIYHSEYGFWQPLSDDGDALRLAVKLNFNICKRDHEVEIFNDNNGEFLCSISISEGDDPYDATRRAIVRAASEIGKAMP